MYTCPNGTCCTTLLAVSKGIKKAIGFPSILQQARAHLIRCSETRVEPRVSRRTADFYVYKPPYDREEHWQPEYWICTKEAALAQGVRQEIFMQPTF